MKAWYEGHGGREEFDISKPSDFFPAVADKIARKEQNVNATVRAGINDTHYAEWSVCVRSGTQTISQTVNMMPAEYTEKEEAPVYLGNIDALTNAYKHYLMYPNPKKGIVHCVYGRNGVGNAGPFRDRSCDWPIEMFPVKKREKIAKGYIDLSEFMFAKDETDMGDGAKEHRRDTPSVRLFDTLHECALRHVREETDVPVNEKIIQKAEELNAKLAEDAENGGLSSFNEDLKLLMLILQRKVETGDGMGVSRMLAHSESDFPRIMRRESNLLQAMKGSVVKSSDAAGDFSDYGVEVYDATPEQVGFVRRHLGDGLNGSLKHVWRVINRKQKKEFDEYVKNNSISPVKCFWHGSRNECWKSIITEGLKIDVSGITTEDGGSVETTGQMFGKGIYFAPSPSKSFGYTSYRGTRWAHGSDDAAFMGLYAVAYGRPYEVSSWSGSCDYRHKVQNGGYGCCHAYKNSGFLLNDEVVVYSERAACLNYLCMFE